MVGSQFIAKPDQFLAEDIKGDIWMTFRKRYRID